MLSKNEKIIIKFLSEDLKAHDEGGYIFFQDMDYVCEKIKLNHREITKACKKLIERNLCNELANGTTGKIAGVELSHEGSHIPEFKRIKVIEFFLHNILSIPALVLAVIAIIRTLL